VAAVASESASTGRRQTANKWLVAVAVMLATTMEWIDGTIANVALLHIQGASQPGLTKPLGALLLQRPGCSNLGRMRLQEHGRITRSLYLCDWCLESLLAIHINDLFVKFGATPKERRLARPQVSPLKRQRERNAYSHNIEIAKIATVASKPAEFKVKREIHLTIENRLDSL
jgi:hypothetical protein